MATAAGTAIADVCFAGLLSPATAAVATNAEKPTPTMAC
jgi:hypothetical protein